MRFKDSLNQRGSINDFRDEYYNPPYYVRPKNDTATGYHDFKKTEIGPQYISDYKNSLTPQLEPLDQQVQSFKNTLPVLQMDFEKVKCLSIIDGD